MPLQSPVSPGLVALLPQGVPWTFPQGHWRIPSGRGEPQGQAVPPGACREQQNVRVERPPEQKHAEREEEAETPPLRFCARKYTEVSGKSSVSSNAHFTRTHAKALGE